MVSSQIDDKLSRFQPRISQDVSFVMLYMYDCETAVVERTSFLNQSFCRLTSCEVKIAYQKTYTRNEIDKTMVQKVCHIDCNVKTCVASKHDIGRYGWFSFESCDCIWHVVTIMHGWVGFSPA